MRFKVAMIYAFGSNGGFDSLISFCQAVPEDTANDKMMPLIYVNALLESIYDILEDFGNSEKKENIISNIKQIITSQVDSLTDDDIEKVETSQLNDLLEKLKYFGNMSANNNRETEETLELTLCYKLLKCQKFERKRQGILNLISIIEVLEEDENKSGHSNYLKKKKQKYEWLTVQIFLEWIKTNKIIDYVFSEYSHPEIIRKSGEILCKMCKYSLFSKKEIDLIWNVFDSKLHEDMTRATLEVIEIIAKVCDEDTLDNLRKRIHKFKKNSYDIGMIAFMKNFILNEIDNFYNVDNMKNTGAMNKVKNLLNRANKDADSVMSKEHVDLINKDIELLWKLPSEKGIPENVKQAASKSIPEILSNELCSEKTKEKYIEAAKKDIKNGDQIYSNLCFIKSLLVNSQIKFEEIKRITTKYNIIGIIILAGETYLSKLTKLFSEPYDFDNIKQIEYHISSKDPIIMCNHSHKEHIEKMFDIVQYIIEKCVGIFPLENKDIEKMFSVFVSKRISNVESEMLFELITTANKNSRGLDNDNYVINDKKIRKFIFQVCLCKKEYVSPHDYSPKSIRCFKDLFLTINNNDGLVLDKDMTIIKSVKKIDLDGIDSLWEIALQASNPIVQERAGYLLAIIYFLYLDQCNTKQWEKETELVVKELMSIISQKPHDNYEKLNHVKILREYIDTYESLNFPSHFKMFYKKQYEEEDDGEEELMDNSYYSFVNYKWGKQNKANFRVEHTETHEEIYINVDLRDTVIFLKREIAKHFGIGAKEFEIMYGPRHSKFLQASFDWNYVYELIKEIDSYPDNQKPVEIYLDPYNSRDYRERSITYSISENQDYLNCLCNYLKKADILTSLETISVIERLPILSENLSALQDYIQKHKIEKYDHWYTVLKLKFDQLEELFMKMKLLESLLYPSTLSSIDLRDEFVKNCGIKFLIDIFVQSLTVLTKDDNKEKLPLCSSLISKTLKLFSKVIANIEFDSVIDRENSLVLVKSGLDFLEYISTTLQNDLEIAGKLAYQFENDSVILDIFQMFTIIVMNDHSRFKKIYRHKKLKEIIFYFLIDTNYDYMKKEISISLIDFTRRCSSIGKANFKCKITPGEFFINVMHQNFLPIVIEKIYTDSNLNANKIKSKKLEEIEKLKISKCTYYFDLFANLIMEADELEKQQATQILEPLLTEFKSCKRIEGNEDSEDRRLAHLISLISVIFRKCSQLKQEFDDGEFFNFVLKDCLFRRRKDKSEINYPICKSDLTREKCFDLLIELMNTKKNKYFK